MAIDSGAAPMHDGTVARIYENSLSGIATRYVVLEPASAEAPAIPDGGTIGEDHTYSFVSLDQVFDAIDPLTRAGLRGIIQGEAASIQGRAGAASKTLKYLAPGLASTSNLTAELDRNEPAFDGLLVEGAQTMQALASRAQQLSDLIVQANTTTGAIASQSTALEQALRAPSGHAQPLDRHLRRAEQHARRARSARGEVEDRRAPARAVRRQPQHLRQGRHPHRDRAQRPDPQPRPAPATSPRCSNRRRSSRSSPPPPSRT